MTLHKNIPLEGMHKAYNWEYADAAARVAASGLTSEDVGKFARQLSDDSIWMLLTTAPTWGAVGGSGGVTLATERVHVDATNGADSASTTGALTDPYQTLAYAAAQQPNPTDQAEYGTECLFVLEPGIYAGDVTLPYRSGVSIQGELATITGDIYWSQDPDMMFAYPGIPTSLYGRAALKIGSPTSNPIRITGDIISQNVNPSLTQEVGDKYFIANRMVLEGSFMNLASGGTTSANEATGPVHTIWDLCQFPTAATVIFAEGESGTFGKNQIYLNARNCYMVSRVCGNIEIDHLNGVGIYKFDKASGRPGGVATTSYDGNIGGSTYKGALGMVNCVNLGGGAFFDFGIEGANAYTVNDVWMDDHSWGAIEDDTSFVGFTDPQPCSLSRDKWKWGSARIIWLDKTDGLSNSKGTGSAASPYKTITEVFDFLNIEATEDDYTVMIAPGTYDCSGLTLEQRDKITFVALGEVEFSGTFQYEANGGVGSDANISFVGQGTTDGRGRPSFQLDGFTAQNAVASSGMVTVVLNASDAWFQGAIQALASGSSYGSSTVSIEARIKRCSLTGTSTSSMTGGMWESSGVDNPLFMRVEDSYFQHRVSGITFMDMYDCKLLSLYMGPEYNPYDGSSGYGGAFAYWEFGWFGIIGVEGLPETTGEIVFEVPASLPFFAKSKLPLDGKTLNYIAKMGFNSLPWTGFDADGYRLVVDGRVFGSDGIAIGYGAGMSMHDCTEHSVGIGRNALNAITGSYGRCVAIGEDSLALLASGSDDIAIGCGALDACVNGDKNVATGVGALGALVGGNKNVAAGHEAGAAIVGAEKTVFVGHQAGLTMTGQDSTVVGGGAGDSATTGDGNTLVGADSGHSIGVGADNTYLGKNAGGSALDLSDCVALGKDAGELNEYDERLCIGAGTSPLIGGRFDDETVGVACNTKGTDGPHASFDTGGSFAAGADELSGTSLTIGNGVDGDKKYTVYANSDSGACAITLPRINEGNSRRIIVVKEVGSSVTNGTTITPNAADYIEGNAVGVAITLSTANQTSDSERWIMLQAIEGASNDYWYIIGGGVSEQSYEWSGTTSDATPAEIYVDGVSSEHVVLAAEQTIALTIDVVARKNTTNKSKFWRLDVAAQRDGSNNSALVDTVVKTVLVQSDSSGGTDDWDIAVTVNDTDETLVVTVTGEASSSIAWTAKASTVIKA